MHDHPHDPHHEHELHPENVEETVLWRMDNIELHSVGIDIGTAGTQVIFSKLRLKRMGEELSSRYVIVSRESIYRSAVHLTPYLDEKKINNEQLGRVIEEAYNDAGFKPSDVDTGAVILTGEAIRRENAESIANMIAEQGGDFVCATAGHNMEASLAAYGSGAARMSHDRSSRLLNIDIGGGTTKLAIVENGKVLETAAIYAGGRLVVVDDDGRITRLDPGGKHIAGLLGYSWEIGTQVSQEDLQYMSSWMANAILSAVQERPLPPEIENLFLTTPLQHIDGFDGVVFSGGVGEYVYDREKRYFGDLGLYLGHALRERVNASEFPWKVIPSKECMRATVVGASEYSVQVSGNTIYASDTELLPRKSLQVLRPNYDLQADIDENELAQSISNHFQAFDLVEGETEVALAFRWSGDPSYARVSRFVQGLIGGLPETIAKEKPIILVFDGDIARTVGLLLENEHQLNNRILSIDGILLQDFDFIDIGRKLYPSGTVPVTIKSLVFQL